MSHTNTTTNYNLPQFVGTDKPTWLNDVNGAFSAIDTQMKANADSATSAGTSATTANTSIGTLSNLNTETKTDLVSAVNEVNTDLGTVSGVASQAVTSANSANTKANAIEGYLDISTFTTPTVTGTGFTVDQSNIGCASNTQGTLGKIYGEVRITCNTNTNITVSLQTPLRPSETININGGVLLFWSDSDYEFKPFMSSISINTSGVASVTISGVSGRHYRLYFINSVIFAQNFGDTPLPE